MEQVEELIEPAVFFRINRKVFTSVGAVSQMSKGVDEGLIKFLHCPVGIEHCPS